MSEDRKGIARAIRPPEWDGSPAAMRDELATLLRRTMADEGSSMDTGTGPDSADLWVSVGGVEFFVTIKRSRSQERRDAGLPESPCKSEDPDDMCPLCKCWKMTRAVSS